MEANELIGLIGNIGFPIAITVYILVVQTKTIKALELAVNKLITAIENIKK